MTPTTIDFSAPTEAENVASAQSSAMSDHPMIPTAEVEQPGSSRAPQQVPQMGRARAQGRFTSRTTTIFFAAFHVGAIVALFYFTWSALAVAVITYILAINVGIGMGYHRLLTHRGYKVPKWLEYYHRRLRHAGAGGRPDLLGSHASRPSPEQRP